MRQAIHVKAVPPTGARLKATAQAGSVTVDWREDLGELDNHLAAAQALREKLGWGGTWVAGWLEEGSAHVEVLP